jgi:ribonuclease P protein component
VMKLGKRKTSQNYILYSQKNENSSHRLGIIAKKEIGTAAYRNRMKRYIREFFRLHKHQINGAFDIILMIKKGSSFKRYQEAEKELRRLFYL